MDGERSPAVGLDRDDDRCEWNISAGKGREVVGGRRVDRIHVVIFGERVREREVKAELIERVRVADLAEELPLPGCEALRVAPRDLLGGQRSTAALEGAHDVGGETVGRPRLGVP